DQRLTLVATSPDLDGQPPGPWSIYEVRDAPLVEALAFRPVVVDDPTPSDLDACRARVQARLNSADKVDLKVWPDFIAVPWVNDLSGLDRPLVADGPSTWQHARPDAARGLAQKPLPPAVVTRIHATDDTISFHVSRPGVPVLVKTSYFPNWRASGAQGPW